MNKEEFNQLDILGQMNYINDLLGTGLSLTKACESIGIDRATVRKRFKTKAIILDKELNKYVFEMPIDSKGIEDSKKISTSTDKTLPIKTKLKPVKKHTNLDSIKLLEEKIKTLESQIEATNKRLDNLSSIHINTKNIINTNLKKYENEKVSRNFKIDIDVQQRFKNYCKANTDHKVEDIISTILDEYLKNQNY